MNPDFYEFWDQLEQVLQVLLVNIVIVLFDNLIGLKIRENSVDGFGEPDRSKQFTKTSMQCSHCLYFERLKKPFAIEGLRKRSNFKNVG